MSDAVIMSRGNLGLDVLPEKMALIQKAIINECNVIGKPVLITRVVDTMINTPRPTRYTQPGLCMAAFACTITS
jgi:pyruvate kinase